MTIRQKLLNHLRNNKEQGASVKDLMAVAGQNKPGPIYSHLHRLRTVGNKIEQRDDRFYLVAEGVPAEKEKRSYNYSGTPKYKTLLSTLQDAGTAGVSKEELSHKIGVEQRNLVYHIHILRKNNCKVQYSNGRYILKGKSPEAFKRGMTPADSQPDKVRQPSAVPMPAIQVNDKIVRKLRLLSAEDRSDYLDMLKKANFYSMCAEALINATDYAENIKKEVEDAN